MVSTAFLYGLFTLILLVSARQMLARRREQLQAGDAPAPSWATALRLHGSFADRVLGREVTYQVGNLPLGLGLMYGAGMISALLGIGSGVLKIPAMDSALRLPIKVSSATSNFMIGVTAAASAADRFISPDHPLTAVMLGIVTGSAGGYVLDALKSMAPSLTRDYLRKLLGLPPLVEQPEDPQKGQ